MSLIEEALRRSEGQTVPTLTQAPAREPRVPARHTRPSRSWKGLAIGAFVIAAAGLAWQAWVFVAPAGPTAPLAPAVPAVFSTKPAPAALILNGVIEGSGAPYAIINGELLKVGDSIDGMQLVEVRPGYARLSATWGRKIELQTAN